MSDIDIPWIVIPFVVYLTHPLFALVSALLCGWGVYHFSRRARWAKAIVAGVLGSQLLPLSVLLYDRGATGGSARWLGVLGVLGLALLATIVRIYLR